MVDRYTPEFDDELGEALMIDDDRGDWVSLNDYDELLLRHEQLREKFETIKGMIEDFNWEANKLRL